MKNNQRGLSSIGWLVVLSIASIIITCTVKMVPAYADDRYVVDALKTLVKNNPDLASLKEVQIKSQLGKYLAINSVNSAAENSFEVKKRRGGVVVNSIYEVRVPIIINIDVVMTFKHQLDTQNASACCKYIVKEVDES
ncbi:MAG: hypothetical protein ACI9Y1_001255 [Lentisphaeria bacterium]|jgi:hypothetical protein